MICIDAADSMNEEIVACSLPEAMQLVSPDVCLTANVTPNSGHAPNIVESTPANLCVNPEQ